MASEKISAMPILSSPTSDAIMPIVQTGSNYAATLSTLSTYFQAALPPYSDITINHSEVFNGAASGNILYDAVGGVVAEDGVATLNGSGDLQTRSLYSDGGGFSTDGSGNVTINGTVSTYSSLYSKGPVAFDSGVINSNGSGQWNTASLYASTTITANGDISGSGNLSILGQTSLDNGDITTNGSGAITTTGAISCVGLTATGSTYCGYMNLSPIGVDGQALTVNAQQGTQSCYFQTAVGSNHFIAMGDGTATTTPLLVAGASGQTANIFEVDDYTSTALLSVNSDGNLYVANPITTPSGTGITASGTFTTFQFVNGICVAAS